MTVANDAWQRRKKTERRAKEAGATSDYEVKTLTESYASRDENAAQVKEYHRDSDAVALRFLSAVGWKPGDKIDVSNLQSSIDRIQNDRIREGKIAANTRTYRDVNTASEPNSAFVNPNNTRRYAYGDDQPTSDEASEIRKALDLGYLEVIPKDWRAQMEKIEEKGSGASSYARNA